MSGNAALASPAARARGRVLRASVWVPAPPAAVWPFFSDAHNLPLLTPPWLAFRILTPPPIAMHVDARIDYRLHVHGVPVRWRTRIARWEPPVCFADEQERGPYRHWLHLHTFDAVDGGTAIGDHVEFVVRGGPFGPLLSRWLVEPDLQRIFHYRMQRIVDRFGGDVGRGRVAIEAAPGRCGL